MTTTIPTVAGMFYPEDPAELRHIVQKFLKQAQDKKKLPIPKAIIAPHAGYIYSGPVAASAYACLANASNINQVIILAPAHHAYFRGIATLPTDFYATPLGKVPIDRDAIENITQLSTVIAAEQAFAQEHALEVQLPFLQILLPKFALIPLLIGDVTPPQVAAVLEQLWGDENTLIVVSSDLSHYLTYRNAQTVDKRNQEAILNLNADAINAASACGHIAIAGLLIIAKKKNLHATAIDLCTSGDTAGPKDAVVGYGAFHFGEKP